MNDIEKVELPILFESFKYELSIAEIRALGLITRFGCNIHDLSKEKKEWIIKKPISKAGRKPFIEIEKKLIECGLITAEGSSLTLISKEQIKAHQYISSELFDKKIQKNSKSEFYLKNQRCVFIYYLSQWKDNSIKIGEEMLSVQFSNENCHRNRDIKNICEHLEIENFYFGYKINNTYCTTKPKKKGTEEHEKDVKKIEVVEEQPFESEHIFSNFNSNPMMNTFQEFKSIKSNHIEHNPEPPSTPSLSDIFGIDEPEPILTHEDVSRQLDMLIADVMTIETHYKLDDEDGFLC